MNEPNWKAERIQKLQESIRFFSNPSKLDREKWVVRRLLRALHLDFSEPDLCETPEPADVAFRGANFQVKEIPDEGRRRGDEYKNALERAKSADEYSQLLEQYTPIDISFAEIVTRCFEYSTTLLAQRKYGPLESKKLDLLCYFNWKYHYVVPPVDIATGVAGFRSLAIVSNRYCAVAYARDDAPDFLKVKACYAIEYFEP